MANRFDQILNREQYVPLIQPVPAAALAEMGKGMQEEQNANIDASLKLKDFWKNIKTASFDVQEKARLDPIINGMLNKATDAVIKGDPNARRVLLETQSAINNMPELQLLQHNYEQEVLHDKQKAELYGKQEYQPFLDPHNQFSQERLSGKRGLERYNYTGIKGYTVPMADAKASVANIARTQLTPNGEQLVTRMVNGQPTLMILGENGYTGVTPEMLENVVNYAVDPFLQQTKGGDSFIDQQLLDVLPKGTVQAGPNNPDYIQYGSKTFNPQDPNLQGNIQQELREEAKRFLYSVGVPQLHTLGGGNQIGFAPEHAGKKDEIPEVSKVVPSTSTVVSDNIKNEYTIGNGIMTGIGYAADAVKRSLTGKPPISYDAYKALTGNRGNEDVNSETNKKLLNRAIKLYQYEDTSQWNDDDKKEVINRYVEDFSKETMYYFKGLRTDTKVLENEDKLMFDKGQFADREFINKDTGEVIQGTDMGKVFLDAESKSNSAVWGPDNPYGLPSANEVTVVNSDGSISKFIAKPVIGETTPDEVILSEMYSVKSNPTGEQTIQLPVNGKNEEFTLVYEPTVKQGEYDSKDRYQVTGETVTLFKDGKQVFDPITVPTGGDAIRTLYKTILEKSQTTK